MDLYYLAKWIGAGTESNPFRPAGVDMAAGFSAINLRPDPTVADGWCFVKSPVALTETLNLVTLTDDADDADLLGLTRNKVESRLGINLGSTSKFRRLVLRVLLEHGDDANPARWNQLKAERDGRYRVWLGGLLDEWVPVGGGATYSDTFNRANSTTITAGGTIPWTEVTQDVQIVSNHIEVVTAGATSNRVRYDADLSTADQYAQLRGVGYTFTLTNNKRIEACVRFSSSVGTFYSVVRNFTNNASTATLAIFKTVSGSVTTLSSETLTATANEMLKVTVSGSSLKAFVDGVERTGLAITDTAITGNLRTGFAIFSGGNATHVGIDDWEAGDLAASTNAAAEAATGTGTAYGATGSVSPSAEAATATGTANTPAVSIATPAGVASATGAGNTPAASVAPTAAAAASTGTAYDATVQTGTFTNATAECATATATAGTASAAVAPSAGSASGTGTGNTPTPTVMASAAAATATTVAFVPSPSLAPVAEGPVGVGTAFGPLTAVAPTASQAAAVGTANNATATVTGVVAAVPGSACVAITAASATTAVELVGSATAALTAGSSTATVTGGEC